MKTLAIALAIVAIHPVTEWVLTAQFLCGN